MKGRLALIGLAVAGLAACGTRGALVTPNLPPSASAARGKALIEYYGCGACHVIGGISTANGHVGPPLTSFRSRYHELAGRLPNTPDNLAHLIMRPQQVVPQGVMPNLGIGRSGAESIAAYLYGQ